MSYTLGRGKVFFAPFKTGTTTPGGERYFGNTPEFSLNVERETLDHYNSDEGIREKDDTVPLEVNRSGSFTTDWISLDNVALFFFGEKATISTAGETVEDESLEDVEPGLFYQLGVSESTPTGVRKLAPYATSPDTVNVKVTDSSGVTTYVEGEDYRIDMDLARLEILNGDITKGSDILVSYKTAASTREQVISGSNPIEGAMRFIAFNPKGSNIDYFFPHVSITPNGDYALKGDEYQTIPFSFEILRKPGYAAVYVDGRPMGGA